MDEKENTTSMTGADGASKNVSAENNPIPGAPRPLTSQVTAKATPAPTPSVPGASAIQEDIQKILEGVKLPEREAKKASPLKGNGSRLTFDTKAVASLSDSDIKTPEPNGMSGAKTPPTSPSRSETEHVPEPSPLDIHTEGTLPKEALPRGAVAKSGPSLTGQVGTAFFEESPVSQKGQAEVLPPKAVALPQKVVVPPKSKPPIQKPVPPKTVVPPETRVSVEKPTLVTPPEPRVEKDFETKMPPLAAPGARVPQGIVVPPKSSAEAKVAVEAQGGAPTLGALSSLRTLREDLQGIVKDKKVSLVRAVALEQEKKQKRNETASTLPQHPRHTYRSLFLALLFLLLGASALLGVYMVMRGQEDRAEPLSNSIIFAEQTSAFPIDNQPPGETKRSLAASRSALELTLGAVSRIIPIVREARADGTFAERAATLVEFMNAIGIVAPNDLTRAVSNEFFFGVHVVDENAPFLIIPVTSYERAFAAMLAWEKTINRDLSPLFTPLPAFVLDANGLLVQRPFEDLVVRNYDARAARDDAGAIQLYYSFPTRNILIIAESTYSFTEILSRLRAERRL